MVKFFLFFLTTRILASYPPSVSLRVLRGQILLFFLISRIFVVYPFLPFPSFLFIFPLFVIFAPKITDTLPKSVSFHENFSRFHTLSHASRSFFYHFNHFFHVFRAFCVFPLPFPPLPPFFAFPSHFSPLCTHTPIPLRVTPCPPWLNSSFFLISHIFDA